MVCQNCKANVPPGLSACPNCGLMLPSQSASTWPPTPGPTGYVDSNTSGTGPLAQLPSELRGFNWGAFGVSFWWSIFNSTWIGLLCLIPYLGFIMCIVLGVKGNEWAWQNRRWDSIDHFKTVQKIWGTWGIALFIFGCLVGIASLVLPAFVAMRGPHS